MPRIDEVSEIWNDKESKYRLIGSYYSQRIK